MNKVVGDLDVHGFARANLIARLRITVVLPTMVFR